jgi:hypothetical protein
MNPARDLNRTSPRDVGRRKEPPTRPPCVWCDAIRVRIAVAARPGQSEHVVGAAAHQHDVARHQHIRLDLVTFVRGAALQGGPQVRTADDTVAMVRLATIPMPCVRRPGISIPFIRQRHASPENWAAQRCTVEATRRFPNALRCRRTPHAHRPKCALRCQVMMNWHPQVGDVGMGGPAVWTTRRLMGTVGG